MKDIKDITPEEHQQYLGKLVEEHSTLTLEKDEEASRRCLYQGRRDHQDNEEDVWDCKSEDVIEYPTVERVLNIRYKITAIRVQKLSQYSAS